MRAVLCLILFWGLSTNVLAQPEARPDPLHSSYQHDRWDTQPKDILREFRAYTSSFDSDDDNDGDGRADVWGTPEWVSYELRAGTDRSEYESRPSTWHTDRELYNASIAPRDQSYVRTGYDRGHLCMRQHARRLGKNADWNSHSVLNAVPQEHPFNDGHWLSLEKMSAIWANNYGSVWVIAGPIMHNTSGRRKPYEWIPHAGDELQVAVPHKLFKIVVRESDIANRPDVLAFVYDNDPSLNDKSLSANHTPFLKSVREIERLTGLDFFNALPVTDQDAIESDPATELWPLDVTDERNRFRIFAFDPNAAPRLSAAEISLLYDQELMAVDPQLEAAVPVECPRCCLTRRQFRKWCRKCR